MNPEIKCVFILAFGLSFKLYAQQPKEKIQDFDPDQTTNIELVIEEEKSEIADEEGYFMVEENATFQNGSLQDFSIWVMENIHYPEEAKNNLIQGKVFIQFSVDTLGSVCNTNILRAVDPLLDAEASRVVKNSPVWKPAKLNGKLVRQNFIIPVKFSLE